MDSMNRRSFLGNAGVGTFALGSLAESGNELGAVSERVGQRDAKTAAPTRYAVQQFAGGIPNEVRVVFVPPMWDSPKLLHLESGFAYRALFFNPRTGEEHAIGEVTSDAAGTWQAPLLPTFAQWVLGLEKKR